MIHVTLVPPWSVAYDSLDPNSEVSSTTCFGSIHTTSIKPDRKMSSMSNASSSTLILNNVDIISDGVRLTNQAITIASGMITRISHSIGEPYPVDAKILDMKGRTVLPGLIDLQIYGSGGLLFGGTPDLAAIKQLECDLIQQGVTGFLATIATNTAEVVQAGFDAAEEYKVSTEQVGNFWGLHLEGPYLHPARRGAHPEHLLRQATMEEVADVVSCAQGNIKMMTIAPERVDKEIMQYLDRAGIVLSAGHSNATYAEGKQFIHQPIRTVTHLFNAMPGLHHRDLGYILAVLEEKPFASIVADGIHVAFPMVKLAKRELGHKLFLITDAVTNTERGVYPHKLQNNDRYVMPDGTLSGSALTLLKAVRNCVDYCDISTPEAVNMASLYPAQVLQVEDRKGRVAEGCDADLCVVDADLTVVMTIIGGQCVYERVTDVGQRIDDEGDL